MSENTILTRDTTKEPIMEIKRDAKKLPKAETLQERQDSFIILIEKYKVQNPVKYEIKKEALAIQLKILDDALKSKKEKTSINRTVMPTEIDAAKTALEEVREKEETKAAEKPEPATLKPVVEANPYEKMTNKELRAELKEKGLSTSGNKANLIKRLVEANK